MLEMAWTVAHYPYAWKPLLAAGKGRSTVHSTGSRLSRAAATSLLPAATLVLTFGCGHPPAEQPTPTGVWCEGTPVLVVRAFLPPAGEERWAVVLAGTPPLLFLAMHHVLRIAFRGATGREPSIAFTVLPGRRAAPRFFFEPAVKRSTSKADYAYSFLLGLALLLATAPALGRIID